MIIDFGDDRLKDRNFVESGVMQCCGTNIGSK